MDDKADAINRATESCNLAQRDSEYEYQVSQPIYDRIQENTDDHDLLEIRSSLWWRAGSVGDVDISIAAGVRDSTNHAADNSERK